MANNGKDPNFNMLWRDLDRALSMPVFTKHEMTLMQVARELSYTASVIEGSRRARPFRIHIAKLAERRGLTRENLSRALTDLLADHVFLGTRDRLKINKHYRQWIGKHALTTHQIRECEDAITNPVTDCGESLPLGPIASKDGLTDEEPICDENVTAVTKTSQPSDDFVMKKSQDSDPVTKKSRARDEKVTESASPLEPPSRNPKQSNSPPNPPSGGNGVGGESAPQPESDSTSRPDPEAKLIELARTTLGKRFELEDYALNIRGWLLSFPADWVRDAIYCTAAKTDIRGGLALYTLGCLRKWQQRGSPKRDEVRDAMKAVNSSSTLLPQDQPHAAPSTSRHRRFAHD